MGYFRSSLLPCLFILVTVVVAYGQGQNSLQGRVISPEGMQPTSPVKVTLTFNGRRVFETFSDLSGRYSFSGLVRGTYQVTAEGDGQTFETTSVSVQVSQFGSSAQLFTQDIQLRPIRGKAGDIRVGVVNAFTQDVPKSAREKFEKAQKLASQGNSEPVMVNLREAIRIFPQYFEAHLMLGNQLLQTGRLEEAIPQLDRAREINPNDERVYQSFGLLLMKQRKYPIAVAIFAEAARLSPSNPVNPLMKASALIYQAAYVDPGSSTQRNDLLQQAELALSQASELSNGRVKADSPTLAMLYELKGETSKAADQLEDYLRKNPTAKNAEGIKQEIARLRAKAN